MLFKSSKNREEITENIKERRFSVLIEFFCIFSNILFRMYRQKTGIEIFYLKLSGGHEKLGNFENIYKLLLGYS